LSILANLFLFLTHPHGKTHTGVLQEYAPLMLSHPTLMTTCLDCYLIKLRLLLISFPVNLMFLHASLELGDVTPFSAAGTNEPPALWGDNQAFSVGLLGLLTATWSLGRVAVPWGI